MMIKYNHDSLNHRAGFGRRGPVFELSWWMLAFLISCWISQFITINIFQLVHLYSKTWLEEVIYKYDTGIGLIFNSSTVFANSLLSNAESYNNWMGSCCIIFGERRGTKIVMVLIRIIQVSWGYNYFQMVCCIE